jgi:cysteinyl-tRNA synthetase
MALQLYNARTRRLEEFGSMQPGKVKMYACGPTIHDFAHIGNFRTFVFCDLLRRYLKFSGYEVRFVMNLTDVEDKIIRKSQERGLDALTFTKEYEEAFFKDLAALNIDRADHHPRATDPEVMDKMAEMIGQMLEQGNAYKAEDGSIFFSIASFPEYGQFARLNLEEMRGGERVANDEYEKDSAADFALWKAWTPEDGSVFWEYPVTGKGRPGWHLECSAMGILYLGEQFDLHLGGIDLLFPHHQNEIAQSECCTGKRFVNFWVHSQHLHVEGHKMSKSLGNYYTLRDLMGGRAAGGLKAEQSKHSERAWDPMAIRLALLKVPHGTMMNFTFDELHSASANLERLHGFVVRCRELAGASRTGAVTHALTEQALRDFCEAMDDDLNTSLALAAVFGLVTSANKLFDQGSEQATTVARASLALLERLDGVLGLRLLEDTAERLGEEEEGWLKARQEARAAKNWAESDRLRDRLKEAGIVVEDTPQGMRWTRARV